jgi:hypothetical protein
MGEFFYLQTMHFISDNQSTYKFPILNIPNPMGMGAVPKILGKKMLEQINITLQYCVESLFV